MTCKTRKGLLMLSLAAGLLLIKFDGVQARSHVEPVRCQASAPCACAPARARPAFKFWTCQRAIGFAVGATVFMPEKSPEMEAMQGLQWNAPWHAGHWLIR